MNTSTHYKQNGFSLLEQAIILPFAIIVLLGVIDATTIFQAYTSLQDGVSEALRCLTPTDGQCSSIKSTIEQRYHVMRASKQNTWQIPQYGYTASLEYLSAPLMANSSYTLQIQNQPTAFIGENKQSALTPSFKYQTSDKKWQAYPSAINYFDKNNRIKGYVNNPKKFQVLGTLSFIPATLPSTPCYLAKLEGQTYYPDFNTKCSNTINLVIHINGHGNADTATSSQGAIRLYYTTGDKQPTIPSDIKDYDFIPSWHSLGGYEFSSNEDASLFTRGNKLENIKGNTDLIKSIKEYHQTYNDIKIKRNEKLWLLFILKRESGSYLAWQLERLQIFTEILQPEQLCYLKCSSQNENLETSTTKAPQKCLAYYHGNLVPEETLSKIYQVSPLLACKFNACNQPVSPSRLRNDIELKDDKLFSLSYPLEELKNEPDFGCLNINKKQFSIPYTSDPICNWEKTIRTKLAQTPEYNERYASYYKINREEQAARYSTNAPELECDLAKKISQLTSDFEPIEGEPFLWSEIPSYCFDDSPWQCNITPLPAEEIIKNNHDLTTANDIANRAIATTIPWSKSTTDITHCKSKACHNVTSKFDGESFSVSASLHLPLKTLKIFNNSAINLYYTDEAKWEGNL